MIFGLVIIGVSDIINWQTVRKSLMTCLNTSADDRRSM